MITNIRKDAYISSCGGYRYRLERWWDESKPPCLFVMLNPSTADASNDDPTIRRCIAFAKSWGYGGIWVVNLFALRTPSPKEMMENPKPNPGDEEYQMKLVMDFVREKKGICIAAWGAHGWWQQQNQKVIKWFRDKNIPLFALGFTKDGHPKHPLYVRGDTKPVEFAV